MFIECPKCHGVCTAPKYPGSGGCDTCMGNGVIMTDKPEECYDDYCYKCNEPFMRGVDHEHDEHQPATLFNAQDESEESDKSV